MQQEDKQQLPVVGEVDCGELSRKDTRSKIKDNESAQSVHQSVMKNNRRNKATFMVQNTTV